MKKKNIKKIIIITLLGFFLNFSFVVASEVDDFEKMINDFFESNSDITIINNNIEASSNTGGNVAEGGEVINGKSESSLKLESTVNGEVIEDIKIVEENEGEASVNYKSVIEINDDKLKIESSRDINGEIEKKSEEFLMDKDTKEEINTFLSEESDFSKPELEMNGIKYQEIIFDIENEENYKGEDNLEEDSPVTKFFSIIMNLFKNNIDKISKLFY